MGQTNQSLLVTQRNAIMDGLLGSLLVRFSEIDRFGFGVGYPSIRFNSDNTGVLLPQAGK